jgi:hypothetical protein
MSDSDKSFHDNLDLLIKLLRKLKEKSSGNEIPGIPKMFFSNFDFVINNYEMMKNQISDQLLNQFGDSIKQMVAEMVEQLKEEVGDDFELEEEFEASTDDIELEPGSDTQDALEKIDEMLKKPGITENEINRLLDERSKLKDNS